MQSTSIGLASNLDRNCCAISPDNDRYLITGSYLKPKTTSNQWQSEIYIYDFYSDKEWNHEFINEMNFDDDDDGQNYDIIKCEFAIYEPYVFIIFRNGTLVIYDLNLRKVEKHMLNFWKIQTIFSQYLTPFQWNMNQKMSH